jgi:hypothetical protein
MEAKEWTAGASLTAAAFLRIGTLNVGQKLDKIIEFLGNVPMKSPEGDKDTPFNCVVWAREGIRVLAKRGVLKCEDVDKLEEEVRNIARERRMGIELGTGKPGKADSKYSK